MKNRKSLNIKPEKRILILCEGESEQIYLNGFRNEERNRRSLSALEIYQPEDYSPYGLLTEAKKRLREAKKDHVPYNEVWIAFDKDGHANIPKTFDEARVSNVKIAFSLICFECWILLHFKQTSKPFKNCDEIIKYIKDNNFISDYDKTNFYPLVRALIDVADNNAKWLHSQNKTDLDNGRFPYQLNAYTNFDELIDSLKKANK